MNKKLNIICFGEVLWDIFPSYKKIGGAPLNVALRLQSLGNTVSMISSVGNDKNGEALTKYIQENGVNTSFIQVNDQYKTGEALVTLDKKGVASYTITHPCAWDRIRESESAIPLIKASDAIIYGSLASRDHISKNSLLKLLVRAPYKVFDVNLRPPHYSRETLIALMQNADFIKLNDEELIEISSSFNSEYRTPEERILAIAEKTATGHICVTKGKNGAVLFYNHKWYYNSGYPVKVADTVGAGDSFLASLIHGLLNKKQPQQAIDFACATGALVAAQNGANPPVSEADINALIHSNN